MITTRCVKCQFVWSPPVGLFGTNDCACPSCKNCFAVELVEEDAAAGGSLALAGACHDYCEAEAEVRKNKAEAGWQVQFIPKNETVQTVQVVSQRLYAFWEHDTYPYVLGGTVVEMNKDGLVRTEFGRGYWFKPIKILPVNAGLIVQEALNSLRYGHREAVRKLHKEWVTKLRDTFPDPKVGRD